MLLFTDGGEAWPGLNGPWSWIDGVWPVSAPRSGFRSLYHHSYSSAGHLRYDLSGDEQDSHVVWGYGAYFNVPIVHSESWMTFYTNDNRTQYLRLSHTGSSVFRLSYVSEMLYEDIMIVPSGDWIFVEFDVFIDDENGFFRVYINDQLKFEFNGDTEKSGEPLVTSCRFHRPYDWLASSHTWVYTDDHYILNSKGDSLNERLGPIRLLPGLPIADGPMIEWQSNNKNHYEEVNDFNSNTKVWAVEENLIELFEIEEPPLEENEIILARSVHSLGKSVSNMGQNFRVVDWNDGDLIFSSLVPINITLKDRVSVLEGSGNTVGIISGGGV